MSDVTWDPDELASSLDEETPLVQDLRAALLKQQRATAAAKRKTSDLVAAVYSAARDAALALGPVPRWKRAPEDGEGDVLPLLHTTDWQCGKKTESFDMAVLGTRLEEMTSKAEALTRDVSTGRRVGGAHVALGGDMVEGVSIFPGQAWEVEAGVYEQLFKTVSYECAVIDRAIEIWGTVDVWEEYGNHGRLGRIGEHLPEDNFDLISYRIAAERYAGHPNVRWHAATDWCQVMELGAYRALLVHGDEIRSFTNHPVHAIQQKVTRWQTMFAAEGRPFQDAYMGHFHRPDTYTLPAAGSIYITGSPESGSGYAAVHIAALGKPSQRLHFVDPEKGYVWSEHRLWLT